MIRATLLRSVPVVCLLALPARAQEAGPSDVTNLGTVSTQNGGGPVAEVAPSPVGDRAQARAEKRLAPNVIEVQPQEEIRKLPDIDVAEALQRLPGISLESDTGEGRFINIRGLDADLNGTTFGGVRLLPTNPGSPFGGSRAVAYDTIPASFVGGLVVTESLRPEQDAEGLGGQVDIVPRQAVKDGRLHLDAEIIAGVETLRDSPVVAGDITISGNFGYEAGTEPWRQFTGAPSTPNTPSGTFFSNPRPFSFVVTESNYNDIRGVDDQEPAYNDGPLASSKLLSAVDLRRYNYDRRRFGRGGEFDYQPNDGDKWFFRYFTSGYTEHVSRHILNFGGLDSGLDPATGIQQLSPLGQGFLAPAATATQSLRNEQESLQNTVITWGGENLLGGVVKVDYRGAYVEGSYSKPYDYNSSFGSTSTFPLAYDNANSTHPSYAPLNGFNPADPNNYAFGSLNNSQEKARDREWSGVANVAAPLDFDDVTGTIKGGGGVRLRERTVYAPQQNYASDQAFPFSQFSFGADQTYYDGRYNIGPQPSPNIAGLIGTPALFLSSPVSDGARSAESVQDNVENVYAQYIQYDAKLGAFGLLTGIRFEETQARYGANTVTVAADGNSFAVTPSANKQSYFDFFPTAQLRYEFEPTLIGRLAYSTAIARPGFNQITAATTVDVGNQSVTTGNPALLPTTVDSFDIGVEKYTPYGGTISLAAFGKVFQNYILPVQSRTSSYPGITGVTSINSFIDGGAAHAYGIEAILTQKFDFLPYPLNGLGFDGNYTYVQSGVQLRPGEGDEPLPSTSDHNFNAALFYELAPVEARIAAGYVSKNLFAIGASRNVDIFSQPRFRLDLGARYRINENFEVFTDVKNLTDTTLKFTEGQHSTRPIQREFYGPTVLVGLRATI